MRVDKDKCVGCGSCVPYCPMQALSVGDDSLEIDDDECVECNMCVRAGVCPTEALEMQELTWPRVIRGAFSDVRRTHAKTGTGGRGTEEMKTNEVTGRFRPGYVGIAIEMGRPGTGARFFEVEKLAMAVAKHGVKFPELNPVTQLMVDQATGRINPEVLNEKVLSAIIEFEIPLGKTEAILYTIKDIAAELETVFSLDICGRVTEDNVVSHVAPAREAGFAVSSNGKTNVGLGRAAEKGGSRA